MSMTIQSSVKDKILATSIDTSKVENVPAEMLRDLDQQMEKRAVMVSTLWIKLYSEYEYEICYHPSKENVVTDALSQKERVKPDEWNFGDDQTQSEMDDLPRGLANVVKSVRDAIGFEYCLASSSRKTKSHVLWAEIRETSLTGLELVQETTDKVVLVKEKPKAARDYQKSYVDYRCKLLEFKVGDHVLLKVTPCLADANLHVPLDEIEADKTLHFVEETLGIMDREI
nr:putative reverse transcriptase domain-containing protein [Tanacetum cinerariifolium]